MDFSSTRGHFASENSTAANFDSEFAPLASADDSFDGSENATAQNATATNVVADEIEVAAWLRLAFVALPAGRCNSALLYWKTPQALLDAAQLGHDAELLRTPGITPTTVERLRESSTRNLDAALEAMQTHGIRLMLRRDADYPKSLAAIPDPPPYIFVRGEIAPADEIAVAIVGTRHTTEYGRGIAHALARDLASRGVTVVSGLARGVDTAAHRGALDGGGRTFAVCGCGLDIVYPGENRQLMEQIGESGACWSEFAPTAHPESWHFPARNRIISGLSAGVIVVEAGERSGALITADFAMEQGRDVFAVPGNIHKAQSRGAHALIKQGATLVENVDDVLTALNNRALPFELREKTEPRAKSSTRSAAKKSTASRNVSPNAPLQLSIDTPTQSPGNSSGSSAISTKEVPQSVANTPRAELTQTENRVYLALDFEARHMDDVAASAQMGAGETNSTLVLLELKGFARRLPGGMFIRAA